MFIYFVLFGLTAMSFVSCGPPIIGYNTAGKLNKNEEYKSVMAYLDQDPVIEKETMITGSTDKFKVLIYKRWIMTYGSGYSFFNSDKFDLFVVSFKNDKLFFWGNLDDFKRTDDTLINNLGTFVSETWLNH